MGTNLYDMGIVPVSFYADESLSAYQYYACMPASTAGYVKRATGASNPVPLGVIQDDNAGEVGEAVSVKMFGMTLAIVSGCDVNDQACAIAFGDFLTLGDGESGRFYVAGSDALHCARSMGALSSGSAKLPIFFYGNSICGAEAS